MPGVVGAHLLRHRGRRQQRFGTRHQSEEKVPLVGLAIRSAVSPEAHFLGIVGAEFITKELAAGSTPRPQLAVHDR